MERRLLLDVIIRECATVLKLFPSKDQPLLVGWDAITGVRSGSNLKRGTVYIPFLVLNLVLDRLN